MHFRFVTYPSHRSNLEKKNNNNWNNNNNVNEKQQ